ncbi:GH23156 [Drosophila grimshawi]|uniref:GH23156 n=1 Tax=Drosophila grimshawi TaxID=7222 RepID=B4JVN8_DROGR|nr:GH23156 [Drosophila grimshawi]
MDDPSIKKRLIDVGNDDHEYDEVEELPEEPKSSQVLQSTSTSQNSINIGDNTVTASSHISDVGGIRAEDLPPELPPPKQKSVKNSKNKQKQKTAANKSKIPRSPSLASSLSSLASSFSGSHGNNNNNNNNVPPQTPPLPTSYQQQNKNKAKLMNGAENNGGASATPVAAPVTPVKSNNALQDCKSTMGIGSNVQLSQVFTTDGGDSGTSLEASPCSSGAPRPQVQITPIVQATKSSTPNPASPKNFQYLTLTVRKDENGYGMKVSGDNPVFVESVKPGGAAQIAGLVAGDMILKVNGQEVRLEKHPTVVSLIKASTIVELAVKRSQKVARPTSVGIVPTTPVLSGRDRTASITGPQPVDSIKRREMESYKIQTLQKMLEQEKLNLERLKGDTHNPSYKLSEANIRKLREQLRQVGAEDTPTIKCQAAASDKNTELLMHNQIQNLSAVTTPHHNQHHHLSNNNNNHHRQQASTPQSQSAQHSSPAFLSLLPRSLSSLSLGTRKNKIDKDLLTSTLHNTTDIVPHQRTPDAFNPMSQSLYHHIHTNMANMQPNTQRSLQQQYVYQQQQRFKETLKSTSATKGKNKFTISKSLIEEDIPPPLPQRNPTRQLALDLGKANNIHLFSPVSDLDRAGSPQRNSPQSLANASNSSGSPFNNNNSNSNVKTKRSKVKTKALSDPKMTTQMFLQMETTCRSVATEDMVHSSSFDVDCVPPPLPPRQPGMLSEEVNRGSCHNLNNGRPQPNSLCTVYNYPLVSTCTAVQSDNIKAAFPLSQRPNIVKQLQQHQQHQPLSGVPTAVLGQTPQLNQMKHRRVGSSPDNMHPRHPDRLVKTTSGSWEIVEKDTEVTPPGTPPPPYLTSSHMPVPEDPNENCSGGAGIFIESHHFTPMACATSPSQQPLHSNRIQASQSTDTQKEIISMEDENSSDQEEPFIDENGPFNNLTRLLESENVVFLAVFLNYVLSNSEPAPLLFYLITELYKEGTSKDMRKWAYEIHSTFLVPRAPLSWYRQDESLAREVDNVLQLEFDKVEILRTVFLRSRKRAKDLISEQLREFQQKRTAGLGTIYGPTDDKLAEAKADKQREQIIDKYLMPNLQLLIEEVEKDLPQEDARRLALCSALSTVIHRIFTTRSHPNSIVDRVHHFVSREKSFKSRLMGKNRKMIVRGHPLVLRQYYEVTHCNHCQTIIWGVSPQGYHCTDCKLNIHRPCSKVLDESCPGPLPQAKRHPHNDNKISKFMGKIRPRTSDFIANEKRARQDEEMETELSNDRVQSSPIVRQPSDRRLDANISFRSNGNTSINSSVLNNSDLQTSFNAVSNANENTTGSGSFAGVADLTTSSGSATLSNSLTGGIGMNSTTDLNASESTESKDARRESFHPQHKSAPVSVNRSESYKERLSSKRSRNSRRKTSDPSLSSRATDEQPDVGISTPKYTGGSNSSLSSGGDSDSPSISMEQVTGGIAGATAGINAISSASNLHQHPHPHLLIQQHASQHSQQDSFQGSVGSGSSASNTSFWNAHQPLQRPWNIDSDDEDDFNEADWSSLVAVEMLSALSDAEKKRQEIINEIFQTERNHVRTLRLLDRLFFLPLYDSALLSQDHLLILFPPALLSLRELHGAFEQKLKQRRVEHNHVVKHIGDLLTDMFDGQSGEVLCEHAAQFCARQQIALEALKEKRHKDEQLQKLLKKSESHKACRRLELKDLLPTVLQRLTKYPLLFENLYKVTVRVLPENTTEADSIQRAVESSKKILVEVNKAVKTAEDAHKLQNIQRKLDKSSYDKDEFKKLDLTQHHLVHDGNLTMKKNPSIQLHGLLFENMIVLLTKQDDKYLLKNLHTPLAVSNKPVSPIMNIDSETLVRQEAADKNSFFLIKTKTSQMLELRAPSSSECKTWFKYISDAAAQQHKARSKSSNSQDVPGDDTVVVIASQTPRESVEQTPDRSHPTSATATVTTTPLAPLLPIATVTPAPTASQNYDNDNCRRESANNDNAGYYNVLAKRRLSHNDTGTSISRTMSTRSCGEANNNYPTGLGQDLNAVALRHTQSAREPNSEDRAMNYGLVGGPSKRDSASIVCSNNSNNTRTLLMQSPLVEPTAIQISINPAHTAQPVLTPGERLRRLDASIRDGLLEKQRIICDIFRMPVEHFNEIVDIAMMPEAPKDCADIALAAYDQVQVLTKILNDYMHVSPEMEISAVSTAVCDHCHEKENLKKVSIQSPPPLPPPNKQQAQAQQQTPHLKRMPTLKAHDVEEVAIHEDDDGYCEIDELRLPAISAKSPASTPLAPFKFSSVSATENNLTLAQGDDNNIDIAKRQCNVNVESIPEKPVDELLISSDSSAKKSELVAIPIEDAALNKAHTTLSLINNSTKMAQPMIVTAKDEVLSSTSTFGSGKSCGLNRIQHAYSLEPSVPCHALSTIVSVLNEQISLLLPKINERDIERERLRKENQHLRELLSAMHERQRVDATKETPTDILTILQAADAEFEDDIDAISNTSLTPTPTPIPSAPTSDSDVDLQDQPSSTGSDTLETISTERNIDRELPIVPGSHMLPEALSFIEQEERKENRIENN